MAVKEAKDYHEAGLSSAATKKTKKPCMHVLITVGVARVLY
jgi:hypothetical protein